MSILKSIISNTMARSAAELFNRFGSAIFWVFLARYLGNEALGSFAFAVGFYSLFYNLAGLGLGTALVRDVAKDKSLASPLFSHGLVVGLVSSIIAILLLTVAVFVVNPAPQTVWATLIISVALLPGVGFYWSKSLLSAFENMRPIATARLLENLTKVIIGCLALFLGYGLLEISLIFVLSKIVSFSYVFFKARQTTPLRSNLEKNYFMHLLHLVPNFFSITIVNSLIWSLPVIFLTKISGEAAAGIFSVSFKVVDLVMALLSAFAFALFPIKSKISDKTVFDNLLRMSVKYVFNFSFVISLCLYGLAPILIGIFYGAENIQALETLQILVWMVVPFSIVPILAYGLISQHFQKFDLLANFFTLISMVVSLLLLVPKFSYIGTASSFLISMTVFLLCEFAFVTKIVNPKLTFLKAWPVMLGMAVTGILLLWSSQIPVFIGVFLAPLFYIVFLWSIKFVTVDDKVFFKYLREKQSQ